MHIHFPTLHSWSEQSLWWQVTKSLLRPLPFFILGIPGLTFSMTLLVWEETRKFLMSLNTNNGEPNWWAKNLMW